MRCSILLFGLVLVSGSSNITHGDLITVEATQVGGFYPSGSPDNAVSFQNYFVGYGTSAGSTRTLERRAFFLFDLSGVTGVITEASIALELVAGGVVFGKGDPKLPFDPDADPPVIDPSEEFVLGISGKLAADMTSMMLTDPEVSDIFDSLKGTAIAPPVGFVPGDPVPGEIVIALDADGIAALNSAKGSTVVLSGWMETWSEDTRMFDFDGDGPDGPELVEPSELLFGFSDVHDSDFPTPYLDLTVTAVPESRSFLALMLCTVLISLRKAFSERPFSNHSQSAADKLRAS